MRRTSRSFSSLWYCPHPLSGRQRPGQTTETRNPQEKDVGDCISLINLQGKLNCKYVVGFYFSAKPQRANLRDRWPATPEENLERLADAGFPYDRQIPKCGNCGGKWRSSASKGDSHIIDHYPQKWATPRGAASKNVRLSSASK